MDKTRIEHLIELATAEEKVTMGTLYNASVATLKAYQADNTAAKLRDWQAAEAAIADLASDLEAKYLKKPNIFTNILEALAFLKAQGYKIQKSKLYAAAKKGLLTVQEDRSVLESDALAYAVRAGLEKKVSDKPKIDDQVYADKASAELDLLRARKDKLRFEHDKEMGLYLPKDDVRAEIAMKLGAIEAGVKNMIAVSLVDWIETVGGDPKHAHTLQETIFGELDSLMNEFCTFDELQIIIRPQGPTVKE